MSLHPSSKACGNPHCTDTTQPGKLACRRCWFALPAPLREAIYATWRGRERNGLGAYSENVIEARRLWSAAAQTPTEAA